MWLTTRLPHWARLLGTAATCAVAVALLGRASENGDALVALVGLVALLTTVAVLVATRALSRVWPAPPLLLGATNAVVGTGLGVLALGTAFVLLGVIAAVIAVGLFIAVLAAVLND